VGKIAFNLELKRLIIEVIGEDKFYGSLINPELDKHPKESAQIDGKH
jgi:hypothetical protein